jgi:RNA polymerase sigma factor (sigma-70 family)
VSRPATLTPSAALEVHRLKLAGKPQPAYDDARMAVVTHCEAMVKGVAFRFSGGKGNVGWVALDLDDLREAGRVGVLEAMDRYDPARGRFVTYAHNYVRKAMEREMADAAGLGTYPFRRAMAWRKGWNLPPGQLEAGRSAARLLAGRCSLVVRWHDQPGSDPEAQPQPEPGHRLAVREALGTLDGFSREIIERRFGLGIHPEPQTRKAVGLALGLSPDRVLSFELKAIGRLRRSLEPRRLRPCGP